MLGILDDMMPKADCRKSEAIRELSCPELEVKVVDGVRSSESAQSSERVLSVFSVWTTSTTSNCVFSFVAPSFPSPSPSDFRQS